MLIAIKRVDEHLSKIDPSGSDARHHVMNAKMAISSIIKEQG